MASEKVSAFNLYLLDVFDLVKTPNISSEEAYNIIEEEWKGLNRDIVFYYISKEREIESKRLVNNNNYSQRNIHELHHLMYLRNMYENNHFNRVEFTKSD